MTNQVERHPMVSDPAEVPLVGVKRVTSDVAALTDRGLVREANEDAFFIFRMGRFLERVTSNIPESELPSRYEESGHLMVVADGLGGHEAGDVASRTALITTLQLILRSPKWALKLDDPLTRDTEIAGLLERSRGYLAAVHAALRRRAAEDASLAGMGTTLTGAFSVGGDLFVLHVGDSKAYVLRDGTLRKITHDHTVAQEYADLGVIPQEDVAQHRMHHVLTRAVGMPDEDLHGDMHHLGIQNGDRLLLCSDGLTDMVSEPAIVEAMRTHASSQSACRALVDLAIAAGGKDNVTVVIAGFRVE
jgi:serine/threonine protein phosphatase PrpC